MVFCTASTRSFRCWHMSPSFYAAIFSCDLRIFAISQIAIPPTHFHVLWDDHQPNSVKHQPPKCGAPNLSPQSDRPSRFPRKRYEFPWISKNPRTSSNSPGKNQNWSVMLFQHSLNPFLTKTPTPRIIPRRAKPKLCPSTVKLRKPSQLITASWVSGGSLEASNLEDELVKWIFKDRERWTLYVFGYPRCHWGITNFQAFSGFFCQPTRFPRLQIFGPLTGLSLEEVDSTVESQLIQEVLIPTTNLPPFVHLLLGTSPIWNFNWSVWLTTERYLYHSSSDLPSPRIPIQASPAMAITSEKKMLGNAGTSTGCFPNTSEPRVVNTSLNGLSLWLDSKSSRGTALLHGHHQFLCWHPSVARGKNESISNRSINLSKYNE